MKKSGRSGLFGEEPGVAARQAAALFALAGFLAVVAMPLQPANIGHLVPIAVSDLAVTAMAWWLPWGRWGRYSPLVLAGPAFAVLGFSTWAFGGVATGTGPF